MMATLLGMDLKVALPVCTFRLHAEFPDPPWKIHTLAEKDILLVAYLFCTPSLPPSNSFPEPTLGHQASSLH